MVLAIIWTIAFIITNISALLGSKPSWPQVLIPMALITLDCWVKALS